MFEKFIPLPPHPDSCRGEYREKSWAKYYETLERTATPGKDKSDQNAYLPDPDEIDINIGKMRWLQSLHFPGGFITSVMVYDAPTFDTLFGMVMRYGPVEAYERCLPFVNGEIDTDDSDFKRIHGVENPG